LAARNKRPKRPLAENRGIPTDAADTIEEELLASYLAGTLPADQRALVARHLAASVEAREVLSMALQALKGEKRTRD
jgi:anti-sigma factor RsiW